MDIAVAAKTHNEKSARQNWRQLCDPSLSFEVPFYNEVIALWRSKISTCPIPKRSDISARDIKPFLPHICIVERVHSNPSHYRWKLMGTKVTQVLGEHTGKLFDESLAPEHLQRWTESSDMILGADQPWRFFGEVSLNGRDYLIAENLYLPLADDEGQPRYILGVCRYTPASVDREEMRERIRNAMLSTPHGLL